MGRRDVDSLRELFLTFFEGKGHRRLPSASLIPHGDPTLLLTGAGMVPFKPYFLGQVEPEHTRVTTCQRCLRTGDIDQVGLTDRHATFFEMLGNFSFGDYFKAEAIRWAWEFVTEHLKMPVDRLWVSVYEDDDEAASIWADDVGVSRERIVRLGKEHNFWEIGVGPCGPCSELYYDRGPEVGCGRDTCRPGCDCDRFLEFWNLVFIQFHRDEQGQYHPLERKGIDTGMGLERLATLMQNVGSIFEVDSVRPIIDFVAERAGVRYGDDAAADTSLRVICDHMRGVTFLIHDGVVPSNEGRGYVLRRLLRRAVRHARLLSIHDPFLADVVDVVVRQMQAAYPELAETKARIQDAVRREEARFHETLDQGMDMLEQLMDDLEARGVTVVPGEAVFRLYDTYGFPLELTEEIVKDRGMSVDEEGYRAAMERQRERARAARAKTGYLGDVEGNGYGGFSESLRTEFVGYDELVRASRIVALRAGSENVDRAEAGQKVALVLEATPFYPEGGGQIPDSGTITGAAGQMKVEHVRRLGGSVIVHEGSVVSGSLAVGDDVVAAVDPVEREDIARHHTATHLLHQALRDVLGEHVQQAGSLVAVDRLRFDFTHFEPLTAEVIKELEKRVNDSILANFPVVCEELPLAEAKKRGALMLFGEKYGDIVRMVSIGDYSRELCGGTHVRASGSLGLFQIVSESGVAAGVRRIEAVAGRWALRWVEGQKDVLREAARTLRVGIFDVPRQVEQLLEQVKKARQEVDKLQARLAEAELDSLLAAAETVNGVTVIVGRASLGEMEALRLLGDRLRERTGEASAVVLAGAREGGASLVGMAGAAAVKQGVHVGKVLQAAAPSIGGGGGGRPNMAQAGGRDAAGIDAALARAREVLREQLGVAQPS